MHVQKFDFINLLQKNDKMHGRASHLFCFFLNLFHKFSHVRFSMFLYICRVIKQLPPETFADRFSQELSSLLKLFTEVAETFDSLSLDSKAFPGLQQVNQYTL